MAFAAARGLAALPSASPLAALGCSPSSVSSGVRAPAPAAQLPQSSYQARLYAPASVPAAKGA